MVDGGLDAGVDETLEDLERDAKKRYRSITLGVPWWLVRLKDRNYLGSSPDFRNFAVAQA